MPARTSVAQRFEMFDHTVACMAERLLKVFRKMRKSVQVPDQPTGVKGVRMADLQTAFASNYRSNADQKSIRRTFNRSLDRLTDNDYIAIAANDVVWEGDE